MALNLKHQTAAEFAARYWARVQDAFQRGDKLRYAQLLWWLETKLRSGDITDAQARTTFNTAFGRALTVAQWTTLRTDRIVPAFNRYAAILAEESL